MKIDRYETDALMDVAVRPQLRFMPALNVAFEDIDRMADRLDGLLAARR